MSRSKKSSPKSGPVIRVAQITNPTTKRVILVRVTRDGKLSKRDAEHLGTKRVAQWVEVEARSWKQATAAVRAGKGKRVGVARSRAPRNALKAAA